MAKKKEDFGTNNWKSVTHSSNAAGDVFKQFENERSGGSSTAPIRPGFKKVTGGSSSTAKKPKK